LTVDNFDRASYARLIHALMRGELNLYSTSAQVVKHKPVCMKPFTRPLEFRFHKEEVGIERNSFT